MRFFEIKLNVRLKVEENNERITRVETYNVAADSPDEAVKLLIGHLGALRDAVPYWVRSVSELKVEAYEAY